MFWDNIAWIYDIFADGINRKANRKLCKVVAGLISPTDDVLECACGTGLLSGVIAKRCKSPDGNGLLREDACARPEEVRAISACAV